MRKTLPLIGLLSIVSACERPGADERTGEESAALDDEEAMRRYSAAYVPPSPCAASDWRPLPALDYEQNTLVDGNCIDIPADQVVHIAEGASLIVIARRQLRVGARVRIDGHGAPGERGDPAPRMSSEWRPSGGSEGEQIACICRGTHCRAGWGGGCRPESDPAMRGGRGRPGHPAGSLRIVALEVIAAPDAVIDLRGGPGGPPGESGRTLCTLANHSDGCWSGPAPDSGTGEPGRNGEVLYEVATTNADAILARLVSLTLPTPGEGSTRVIDTRPALLDTWRRAIQFAQDSHYDMRSP